MAQVASPGPPSGVDQVATTRTVDWAAVAAGALLAAAVSFVLLTFGTAIGLSATSPWPNTGLSTKVIASLAVFWALAQQIGAFLIGGYVAGRLVSKWQGRDHAEAEFRDGLHGGLVWALGIVLGAALALAAGGALLRAGADVGARAVASATANPVELAVDVMLRPAPGATPPGRAETSAGDARAELSRLVTRSVAAGGVSDQDRAYFTQRIAQLTGLSQQEADSRINAAIVEARKAADTARRAAVLTGLVTAVSLLASLAAAWWAAVKGGEHRDSAFMPSLRRRVVPGT